jgi:hypothetical protein
VDVSFIELGEDERFFPFEVSSMELVADYFIPKRSERDKEELEV